MAARNTKMDRRELLRMALLGGVGSAWALEQLGGVPLIGTLADRVMRFGSPFTNRYDAFAMMREALVGGPSMFAVHAAMAQDANDWTLVQIKVCNHVFTPLVFRLGQLSGDAVTTGNGVPLPSARAGQASAALIAQGVDQISDKARYKELRFNKWFANILHHGTADGAETAAAANLNGLDAGDVAALDAEKVAVQAFVGLAQDDGTVNHALRGCKLRQQLSDLTLFCQEKGLITSPLGISCFMMGDEYDRAEGATPRNVVLGNGAAEVEVVGSRTVGDYVAQVQQYIGKSYADRAPIEQNVIYRMDKFVVEDPVLRRELVNSIAKFQAGLGPLSGAADLEIRRQTLDRAIGNTQSANGSNTPQAASGEFLAQCKYVAASMDLPGVPVRNFSLFLNMVDLDGKDLDDARNQLNQGQNGQVRAFGYIEGMRQLAMGLNVLGKKIASGKKMIIVVTSEGGRGAGMEDSKTSFALVMGPGGAGGLKDKLYANMEAINGSTGASVADPAAASAAMKWADGLMDAGGAKDANGVPRSGDVQMGVVEFLEEVRGQNVRSGVSSDEGRFVKLARG
jgi:hypothetical protein